MTNVAKRQQRTAAEWNRLVQAWEASGVGAKPFAEGRGISASSLYLWQKRLRAAAPGEARDSGGRGVDFVPVVLQDSAVEPGETEWQLETASGLALRMSGPDAVHGLEVALRVLGEEA